MGIGRFALRLLVGIVLGSSGLAAHAAPDEIQVYTEEMDDPGEFGLELHLNYVPEGRKAPSFDGEMQSHHRLQVTPEFSYGLTRTLEAGLYLPVAVDADGTLYENGLRLRLKYIAPRTEADRFFWGINAELGYSPPRISESAMALELRPILGYRDDQWLVSFNPILDTDLSSNVSREPKFEPALKVTHRVTAGARAGLEYYGEYGPLHDLLPAGSLTHVLYGVMDLDLHGLDMNLGVGHGLKNAEDEWVVKAIIALPLK